MLAQNIKAAYIPVGILPIELGPRWVRIGFNLRLVSFGVICTITPKVLGPQEGIYFEYTCYAYIFMEKLSCITFYTVFTLSKLSLSLLM